MRVLLIQSRKDPAMQQHEAICFAKHSGLAVEDFTPWNLVDAAPRWADIRGHDAIVLGGSGEYWVSKGDLASQLADLTLPLERAIEEGIPVLGVCFGVHILAHVLGGKVGPGPEETGTFEVTRTAASDDDPIFGSLPRSFSAALAHKDHITQLPEGAVNLASSALSTVQAFTIPGICLYAFTYHPELDRDSMRWRMQEYAQNYGFTDAFIESTVASLHPTPEAHRTLKLFLDVATS